MVLVKDSGPECHSFGGTWAVEIQVSADRSTCYWINTPCHTHNTNFDLTGSEK